MVYRIGSARISEYGTIDGKPGDQKGGSEVSIQQYYLHRKGWRVFRAKDPVKSKVIGLTMIDLCENDCFGYGQPDRLTGFNAASKVGFDIKKVKIPVNIDCSVAIRICCMAAGIKTGDFYTANEAKCLLSTNQFTEVTNKIDFKTGDGLQFGDILVTKTKGHTAVVVNGTTGNTNVPIQKSESQSQKVKFVGKIVNCSQLNVRTKPSSLSPIEKKYPVLKCGNMVDVCDIVGDWYYILIDKRVYAYVKAKYVQRT